MTKTMVTVGAIATLVVAFVSLANAAPREKATSYLQLLPARVLPAAETQTG
jgi:hypothetical protein